MSMQISRGSAVPYHEDGTAYGPYTTLTDGTDSLTTSATQLNAGVSVVAKWLLIQADPDNTVDILVGDATPAIQLTPGDSVVLPVSDVNKVYAKTVSSTGSANWLVLA